MSEPYLQANVYRFLQNLLLKHLLQLKTTRSDYELGISNNWWKVRLPEIHSISLCISWSCKCFQLNCCFIDPYGLLQAARVLTVFRKTGVGITWKWGYWLVWFQERLTCHSAPPTRGNTHFRKDGVERGCSTKATWGVFSVVFSDVSMCSSHFAPLLLGLIGGVYSARVFGGIKRWLTSAE